MNMTFKATKKKEWSGIITLPTNVFNSPTGRTIAQYAMSIQNKGQDTEFMFYMEQFKWAQMFLQSEGFTLA